MRSLTTEVRRKVTALGFPHIRPYHDLRVTHETQLLDRGEPVHVVAERCAHDPAVLLRVYAKRTKKADTRTAGVLAGLARDVLGS